MSTEYYEDTPTEQKERLLKIKSRKVRKTVTLPDPRPEPPEPERKVYETVFVCYDTTPIIFGKLKGKHHSILKQPEWKKYCQWVVKQGNEFRYQPTRTYILENVNLE